MANSYTISEVATIMNVAERTVAHWIDAKRLKASGPAGGLGILSTVLHGDLLEFCEEYGKQMHGGTTNGTTEHRDQ